MPIIDMHTHARRGRGELSAFIEEMDRLGIAMAGLAAIEPTSAEMGDSSNEFIHECIQKYPDRLFGWCSVVPTDPAAPARLERYVREMGFKGLKLHPPIQQFMPSDPMAFPTFRKAIELDVPVLMHTGAVNIQKAPIRYGDPVEIDELCLAFPDLKIVLAHGEPLGLQPYIAQKHPNAYMDTSIRFPMVVDLIPGLGERVIMRTTTGVAQLRDKVMLGSDAAPTFLNRFKESLDAVRNLNLPTEVKDNVLGGNAIRLLRLQSPALR